MHPHAILVREIKSRMSWAEHVALCGRAQMHTGFWWGDLRERDHLGGPRRRWEYNIKVYQEIGWGGGRTELIWLTMGGMADCCEHGNEPSGCIKCREFNYVRKW